MKRVQSGCIAQTLLFSQKAESGMTKNEMLRANRQEVVRHQNGLQLSHTRYAIMDEIEQEDGSILLRIKKQINANTDTKEYF